MDQKLLMLAIFNFYIGVSSYYIRFLTVMLMA